MKKLSIFLQKAEETANRAACALFNYGWVVLTALIEICALTETAWNIALAETINWPIAIAGAEVNCMMGNILAERGAKYQNYRDVKISHIESREHLLKQIGQNHCFSISDVALEEGMKEYLQELYPNKSRYEL